MASREELEGRVSELETALDAALARNAELEARLAKLEELMTRSSKNSSTPPSKNPPHVKAGRKSRPTGNAPGGQKGHEPHRFAAIDPASVTHTVDCAPARRCDYCLADLADAPLVTDGEVVTDYRLDVPPVALEVTAYRRRRRQCDHCSHWTLAPLPDGVGASPFGPGLVSLIATLTVRYRLGRRPVRDLLADLFGRRISIGAIQTALETASEAVAGAIEGLRAHIDASPVVGADETGWRDQSDFAAGKRAWCWVATTPAGTLYALMPGRGVASSYGVLGPGFKGIVTCDRWKPYQSRFGNRRQLCWAHLDREATAAIDRGAILCKRTDAKLVFRGEQLVAWGRAFAAVVDLRFGHWQAFKEGRLSRAGLRGAMTTVRVAVGRLLVAGARMDDPAVAGTCRDVLRQFACLWPFVTVEGVEPTNNEPERELRGTVIARSLMLSTKSEAGRTMYARLASVSATCRKQGRNVLRYVEDALERHAMGLSPPALVPG